MSEINKCPFCGSDKSHVAVYDSSYGEYVALVVCKNCEARGPTVDGLEKDRESKKLENDAISAWNACSSTVKWIPTWER